MMANDELIYLLAAYSKADKSDLTTQENALFSALIEDLTHD